jgi:hypothetical protein
MNVVENINAAGSQTEYDEAHTHFDEKPDLKQVLRKDQAHKQQNILKPLSGTQGNQYGSNFGWHLYFPLLSKFVRSYYQSSLGRISLSSLVINLS